MNARDASLYLGLDCGTQSLTALLIDLEQSTIVARRALDFDRDLPHWGTVGGQLPDPDPQRGCAPPLLWVEALDRLLAELAQDADLGRVRALSGSAQQHGSVYLNASAAAALAGPDPSRSLVENLAGTLARPVAPIWTDSSTSRQCAEIRAALGGVRRMVAITGSDAFERFTGPQIRKLYQTSPALYAETETVCLVSSFLASILVGQIAPIDHGDGSGMSLMDLETREWHPGALEATAPNLRARLPSLVPPSQVIGPVAPCFASRYGLDPEARVVVFTGDNPSSLVGAGAVEPGDAVLSLGTSDTLFALLPELRTDPSGLGHLFVAPTGGYMTLLCARNGSLVREAVRDRYGLDWAGFSQALRDTPPGNDGKLLLPWFEPEIVPRLARPWVERFGGLVEEDAAGNCRAVVEAQLLSLKLHSSWMGQSPRALRATGGGSANREFLQIAADVFGCPVLPLDTPDAAALGAALRAAHGCHHAGSPAEPDRARSWRELVAPFTTPASASEIAPRPENAPAYDRLLAELERRLAGKPD